MPDLLHQQTMQGTAISFRHSTMRLTRGAKK